MNSYSKMKAEIKITLKFEYSNTFDLVLYACTDWRLIEQFSWLFYCQILNELTHIALYYN
jgi:hypothetical protein